MGSRAVPIIFSFMMPCIMVATVLVDKNIYSKFPNTVDHADDVYYIIVFFAISCSLAFFIGSGDIPWATGFL